MKFLPFFMGIFMSAFCLAQSNFKPGYVVPLKGDTLKGSIDYREWGRNPDNVKFKDAAGKISTYGTDNARAFGVDNLEYFEKAALSLSTDEVDFSKLKNSYDSSAVYNTVFLKVITTGKYLTLYSYRDALKLRFVAKAKGAQPVELSHHLYLSNSNELVHINRFRSELVVYADTYGQKDEELIARIQRADYELADLTAAVNLINGEDIKKSQSNAHAGVQFFAGLALNMSKLAYSGNSDLKPNSKNYINYIPQLNFGVDYLQNASTGVLVLRGEFSLYSTNLKSVSATAEKQIQNFTLSVSPQFIYNFYNTNALKLFFGSGFVLHFSTSGATTYVVQNPNYTVPLTPTKLNNTWYSVPVKAGALINRKVEVYGYYSFPATADESPFAGYTGKISSFQVGFNYHFGKL